MNDVDRMCSIKTPKIFYIYNWKFSQLHAPFLYLTDLELTNSHLDLKECDVVEICPSAHLQIVYINLVCAIDFRSYSGSY